MQCVDAWRTHPVYSSRQVPVLPSLRHFFAPACQGRSFMALAEALRKEAAQLRSVADVQIAELLGEMRGVNRSPRED